MVDLSACISVCVFNTSLLDLHVRIPDELLRVQNLMIRRKFLYLSINDFTSRDSVCKCSFIHTPSRDRSLATVNKFLLVCLSFTVLIDELYMCFSMVNLCVSFSFLLRGDGFDDFYQKGSSLDPEPSLVPPEDKLKITN